MSADVATPIPPELLLYEKQGFRLVYYGTKTKGPAGPAAVGWDNRSDDPKKYVIGANVGVFLGHEISPGKFLVDVDFDWVSGITMAKRLLPATGFGFGRESKFLSHGFYTSSTPLTSKKYVDVEGKCLVELRGTKADGTVGLQTMVPPSIHPSGEATIMRDSSYIAHIEGIERHVILYAIACLLLQQIGHRGLLHDTRLAAAGFLLGEGLTPDETTNVLEAVAEASGNNVTDVKTTVASSVARIKQGTAVSGKGALAKAIGDTGKKVLSRIQEWLGSTVFLVDKNDKILANNQENIRRAIKKLDADLSFNEFSQKALITFRDYNGPIQDHAMDDLWLSIETEFSFRPEFEYFSKVVRQTSRDNPFHPVKIYLSSLRWDGVERLNSWLIDYGKAADTEYVRAVSALPLIAAVSRAFSPGTKFDELLVLESKQGWMKSTALRTLCPDDDWFSDDLPLGVDAKELIERTIGKWIIEAAELSGLRAAQTEHLKAMLSRQTDGPVRMAFGREPTERPRQFIIIGTTNSHHYLRDHTGNRRFWPVRVERFDITGLKEVRDQLWAEAVTRYRAGESTRLKQDLHAVAGIQQERRRTEDPWEQKIMNNFDFTQRVRVDPDDVWTLLGIPVEHRDERAQVRILNIMQRLGFRRGTVKHSGMKKAVWGFLYEPTEGKFWPDPEKPSPNDE